MDRRKAVAVIEMPDSCSMCEMGMETPAGRVCCLAARMAGGQEGKKPGWCPLVQMPEKADLGKAEGLKGFCVCLGWNECIAELLLSAGIKDMDSAAGQGDLISRSALLQELNEKGIPYRTEISRCIEDAEAVSPGMPWGWNL